MNKIKVLLDRANKWFYCDTKNMNLEVGQRVVVESLKGQECGSVVSVCEDKSIPEEETLVVLRMETEQDKEKVKVLNIQEKDILIETKALVKSLSLDMKLVDIQISLDESKMVISFTSDDRVDFRELVKQLASKYKKRIELRQIGARDEVKIVGAMGPCGRVCCCNGYFNDFCHVSIKMAKVQNLSLNPANISGICGRLLCCLAYENEYYNEISKKMPKVNSEIDTKKGKGKVVFNNLLKQTVDVLMFDSGDVVTFSLEELGIKNEQPNPKNED